MGNLVVTIKDSQGKSFSKSWKSTANKMKAIIWTIESTDVPHYINTDKIISIELSEEM